MASAVAWPLERRSERNANAPAASATTRAAATRILALDRPRRRRRTGSDGRCSPPPPEPLPNAHVWSRADGDGGGGMVAVGADDGSTPGMGGGSFAPYSSNRLTTDRLDGPDLVLQRIDRPRAPVEHVRTSSGHARDRPARAHAVLRRDVHARGGALARRGARVGRPGHHRPRHDGGAGRGGRRRRLTRDPGGARRGV